MTEIRIVDKEGIVKYSELKAETQKDIMTFLSGIEEQSKQQLDILINKYLEKGYSPEEIKTWIEVQIKIIQYSSNAIGLNYTLYVYAKNQHTEEYNYAGTYEKLCISTNYTKQTNETGEKIQNAIYAVIAEKKKIAEAKELEHLREENADLRKQLYEIQNKEEEGE